MISIDTNVIVRFIVADHDEQHALAVDVLSRNDCFVPVTVVLEVAWVLRSLYEFDREQIGRSLLAFLGLPSIHVADAERLHQAFVWHGEGLDFADALHLAASTHCDQLITFDQRFISKAEGKSSCRVIEPSQRN